MVRALARTALLVALIEAIAFFGFPFASPGTDVANAAEPFPPRFFLAQDYCHENHSTTFTAYVGEQKTIHVYLDCLPTGEALHWCSFTLQ